MFEMGDERLLQFAHENQGAFSTPSHFTLQSIGDCQSVPVLIVFTQYDRLVRTKEVELREEYPHMDPKRLRDLSVEEAHGAYTICLHSLQRTANRLRIPMPHHAKASGKFAPL